MQAVVIVVRQVAVERGVHLGQTVEGSPRQTLVVESLDVGNLALFQLGGNALATQPHGWRRAKMIATTVSQTRCTMCGGRRDNGHSAP